ncbi:MAG: TlpA family protein disulfide reductase [Ekhidna sp.]|nr:TlpA family protein disulfide reductase [Ekhidna sp.]
MIRNLMDYFFKKSVNAPKKGVKIREWSIFIFIVGIIYFGGWHKEALVRFQQVVLSTGIFSPGITEEGKAAGFDFLIEDQEGNKIDFREIKGQVVFLNFWANWCLPCIAEMPYINDLYSKKSSEASFFLISIDKDHQKAIDFVKRKAFDFPIYFLDSPLPESYNVQSIPTTYLIDKEGNIRAENHGMAKYDTKKFRTLISNLSKL